MALDLRSVLRAAIELSSRHEREAVLDTLLEELQRLVPFDAAAVLVVESGWLRLVTQRGFRRDLDLRGRRFDPASNPRLARTVKASGTVRFVDPSEPDPFDGLASLDLAHLHSCMAAPMRVDGKLLGVISADAHAPDRFGAEHEEVMELFAALAAVAIRNADLVSELTEARQRLTGEVASLSEEIRESAGGTDIVGGSVAARALREEIALVGPTESSALILGETGTGKELVARAIHAASPRRERPLIRFDCAAVAPNLIESELYGHSRGAFTGAVQARAGKFEIAHGGTLFLDEIGELPLELQPRLLRALQEREVERVGEHQVRKVDVRVIAATNRDLQREVNAGRFRADLYHRLAIYPLKVPPLRERLEDLPELIHHFVDKLAPRLRLGKVEVDHQFLDRLAGYAWPGNVRELENTIERALIRAKAPRRGVVKLDEASARGLGLEEAPARAPARAGAGVAIPEGKTLREATEEFQRAVIEHAIEKAGGNVAEAARLLGEDRSNLHRRLKRLR